MSVAYLESYCKDTVNIMFALLLKSLFFWSRLIYSPRLHLFDQNKVKTVIVGENKI